MKRVMIQADERLLERARQRAADRGVSLAQVVRDALERDLGAPFTPPELTSVGSFDSGVGDLARQADADGYRPPPFRS